MKGWVNLMFCKNCGKEIANNLKYCLYCGMKINQTFTAKLMSIIVAIMLIITSIILLNYHNSNKNYKIIIETNSQAIEDMFSTEKFYGTKILIEPKTFFKPVSQETMRALQFKIENDLYYASPNYKNTLVQQINNRSLLIIVPYEINSDKIIKIIQKKSILEFKKEQNNKWNSVNLSGKDIKNVSYFSYPKDQKLYVVDIIFNKSGTRKLEKITTQLVNKQLGIFLNNELMFSPIVREPIKNGQIQIFGNFTLDEADTITNMLNADKLDVKIISKKVYYPNMKK